MNKPEKENSEQKIGDTLIKCGLIDQNQLNEALRMQNQRGGRLGSILFELGYLTLDELLDFLHHQFGVASTNLYKLEIDPEVLSILPFEKMKDYQAIPMAMGTKTVFVAMVNPHDITAIKDLEFILGKIIQPVVVPYLQMKAALQHIETRGGRTDRPLLGSELEAAKKPGSRGTNTADLHGLLRRLVEERASDLLLTAGVPPSLKKNNEMIRLELPLLTPEQVVAYASELMSDRQRDEFAHSHELDFAFTVKELGRFRTNIYSQRNSVSIAIRHLIEHIPDIASLGLPSWIADFALKSQGLILITGPTGHGKTTTMAALVDIINSRRKSNIVTIEDPIEYLHRHKLSNINQREVGTDTTSFPEGLKHIFRQAPDVIIIGEMRDPESFAIAIEAADSGHLVISTLHATNSTAAIERIIDMFALHRQQQIRVQLAESFLLVLNQRLVRAHHGSERILAYEKLVNTHRIRNLIREGKTHQIRSMFQQASEDYMSIDLSLARLVVEGKITFEEGLKYCDNPAFYREMSSRGKVM